MQCAQHIIRNTQIPKDGIIQKSLVLAMKPVYPLVWLIREYEAVCVDTRLINVVFVIKSAYKISAASSCTMY